MNAFILLRGGSAVGLIYGGGGRVLVCLSAGELVSLGAFFLAADELCVEREGCVLASPGLPEERSVWRSFYGLARCDRELPSTF